MYICFKCIIKWNIIVIIYNVYILEYYLTVENCFIYIFITKTEVEKVKCRI